MIDEHDILVYLKHTIIYKYDIRLFMVIVMLPKAVIKEMLTRNFGIT